MRNKEYGSYFSLETNKKWLIDSDKKHPFFTDEIALCISGRTAIYGILKLGIAKHGWKRVYFPEYYCHEVVDFIKTLPIEVSYYEFNPFVTNHISYDFNDVATSVIINVDFFGINHASDVAISNAVLIDDVTYSILSHTSSTAAYCFASLRKELPVPAGGFCSSPQGRELPAFKHSAEADFLIANSLKAMGMKKAYLEGVAVDKEQFRELYASSETDFSKCILENGALPKEASQVLRSLNVSEIIQQKYVNISQVLNSLPNTIASYCCNENQKGFGLVLYFDTKAIRDSFKQHLVQAKIYPAILWPEQRHNESKWNEDRMLFVHVDYRYNTDDIAYICTTLETTIYEI